MKAAAEKNMPRNFDFTKVEPRVYDWWQENGWFKPESADADAEPYVISMPPPNVTGSLHIGHALFTALEDLMIRYERMRGKAAPSSSSCGGLAPAAIGIANASPWMMACPARS